jgi:hypothetical protein
MTREEAIVCLRGALRNLEEGAAHQPGRPPEISEIFAPQEHTAALDPERSLVVGNRGVGKTFWSSALVDDTARNHLAKLPVYSRLNLGNVEAASGYDGGYSGAVAISRDVIDAAQKAGAGPRRIWEAVLLRHLAPRVGHHFDFDLRQLALWLQENVEESENLLRKVDNYFVKNGKRFLIVFDALDTLGASWSEVRPRLQGLIEFSRLAKSLRAIKPKIFLRVDQAEDRDLWASPDASKLYNERVRLSWSQYALYELLFFHLTRGLEPNNNAFAVLTKRSWKPRHFSEEDHRRAFTAIAGAYMGGGEKRGNTYDWVTNHLADADSETTPRSFLVTLKAAAENHPTSRPGVIDHLDIQAGVVRASEGRIRELEDDYWWIRTAFKPLEGISVPCFPSDFDERWRDAETVENIRALAASEKRLPPLAFEAPRIGLDTTEGENTNERRLRTSLEIIGVLEPRSNGKINVPDIFRIAAHIKRRGGVKPPPLSRRTSS